jgi:hypothetical protein
MCNVVGACVVTSPKSTLKADGLPPPSLVTAFIRDQERTSAAVASTGAVLASIRVSALGTESVDPMQSGKRNEFKNTAKSQVITKRKET